MSLRRNADESFFGFLVDDVIALARNYACDVSSVRGIGRINVRVVVRVIVSVRNFRVIIRLICGHFGIKAVAGLGNLRRDVVFIPRGMIGHRGKRFVRIVKTGIEDSDYHSLAFLVYILRIIYTCGVNVGVVFDGNFRFGISLGKLHAFNTVDFFNRLVICGVNLQGDAVVKNAVRIFELVFDSALVEFIQKRVMRSGYGLFERFCSAACGEFRKSGVVVRFFFIGGIQILAVEFDDYPTLTLELSRFGFSRLNDVFVEILRAEFRRVEFRSDEISRQRFRTVTYVRFGRIRCRKRHGNA